MRRDGADGDGDVRRGLTELHGFSDCNSTIVFDPTARCCHPLSVGRLEEAPPRHPHGGIMSLRYVLLLQRDLQKAVRFYGEAGLGLPVRVVTERWAELSAGPSTLALKATDG